MSRPRFGLRWSRLSGSGRTRILSAIEKGWSPGSRLRDFGRVGKRHGVRIAAGGKGGAA